MIPSLLQKSNFSDLSKVGSSLLSDKLNSNSLSSKVFSSLPSSGSITSILSNPDSLKSNSISSILPNTSSIGSLENLSSKVSLPSSLSSFNTVKPSLLSSKPSKILSKMMNVLRPK